jgi:Rrf2 family transcriptional regulator, repressor of oqxAB
MVDLRFASALQMMLSMAYAQTLGHPTVASSELAEGLGANPSMVRKLVSPLVGAGLVASTKGKLGGMRLARAPADITLADIYSAVVPKGKLFFSRADIVHRCLVTSNIDRIWSQVASETESAVMGALARRTLAHYLNDMFAGEGRAKVAGGDSLPNRAGAG